MLDYKARSSRYRSIVGLIAVAILLLATGFVSGFGSEPQAAPSPTGSPVAESHAALSLANAVPAEIPGDASSLPEPPPVSSPPAQRAPVAAAPASDTGAAEIPNIPSPVELASLTLEPRRQPVRSVAPVPVPRVVRGEIKRGETLSKALRSHGVPSDMIHQVDREMRPVFDFRHSQPGHRYRLAQDAKGRLVDFRYSVSSDRSFHLFPDGDGFVARPEQTEFATRVTSVSGVVETSLYDAIRDVSGSAQLASDFTQLFAWDIDFTRSVHPGDEFQILFEGRYLVDDAGSETFARAGRILAARYRGVTGTQAAVFFEGPDGRGGYYRPDGSSVERQFLAAPLEYSHISSSYSAARRHPILKITRPHHGIDYAAPEGAPIWSVALGTVIYRGWAGGFGNLVKIQHPNGYISYYGHLSRFAKGLQVGDAVEQKQTIGYVGKTGLATGPHVCFRVARDGRFVNPLRVESPAAEGIRGETWPRFEIVRDTLLADLDAGPTLVSNTLEDELL